MGLLQAPEAPDVSGAEDCFLVSMIRRFDGGVTEGHLHMLVFSGQKLGLFEQRYEFQFQHLMPYSERLDLRIAMLLWNRSLRIQDNRLWEVRSRTARHEFPVPDRSDAGVTPGCLDKLTCLSYDSLKLLAVLLHWVRDEGRSRQEAISAAARVFPVLEKQALNLLEGC